jgi:Uma2 family endonuclease
MTAVPTSALRISAGEYLEGEKLAELRHEFVDGAVYAMAGASRRHNLIATNTLVALANHLRGKPCTPFNSDMKVRLPAEWADAFYYPDVSVSCDPADNHAYYLTRPIVLVEVISPETEQTDRREKRLAYRTIPGVKMYVILEQSRIAATVLRAGETGWQTELLEGASALLAWEPIGLTLPLGALYERTELAPAAG